MATIRPVCATFTIVHAQKVNISDHSPNFPFFFSWNRRWSVGSEPALHPFRWGQLSFVSPMQTPRKIWSPVTHPEAPLYIPPVWGVRGCFPLSPPVLWRAEPRWEWCCKVTKSAGSWRRVNSTQRPNKSEIVSRRSVCWIAFGLDSIYIQGGPFCSYTSYTSYVDRNWT